VNGGDRLLRAYHVPQERVDIGLHAASVIEQALGSLEHFVRSGKSRVRVTVEVDDIGSENRGDSCRSERGVTALNCLVRALFGEHLGDALDHRNGFILAAVFTAGGKARLGQQCDGRQYGKHANHGGSSMIEMAPPQWPRTI
jgi:hypothetical protein